jgi:glutaredoxin 3
MHKIEVFAGPQCGYCARAKALLTAKQLAYTEMDITVAENRAELLKRLPRSRTIPQIFIDGEHIGGCEDLELLDKKGYLDSLTSATRKD